MKRFHNLGMRAEKLAQIEIPKNRKQLHTSIGAVGYFRNNIKNFARFTSILTPLLSENVPFKMSEKQIEAFQDMIKAAKDGILSSRPNLNEQMIITSDASGQFYGGTLSQEYGGKKFLLAVHSAHFSQAIQAWNTNVRELVAVVKTIEKFEAEIFGKRFLVRTDSSWTYFLIKNSKKIFYKTAGPVVRLLMRLSRYEFDIVHCPGSSGQMKLADLMSRLNSDRLLLSNKCIGNILSVDTEIDPKNSKIEINPAAPAIVNFGQVTESDQILPPNDANLCSQEILSPVYFSLPKIFTREEIRTFVKKSQKEHESEIISKYSKRPTFDPKELTINNNLVVPEQAVKQVLEMSHLHFGRNRSVKQIKNLNVFWDSFAKDVINFCLSCPKCTQVRHRVDKVNGETLPRGPLRPFQSVALDILQCGQKDDVVHILGLVCHLTHFVRLVTVKSQKMEDCLNEIFVFIIEYNVTECEIRSDNAFNNSQYIEFMNLLNCKPTFGIPANSRSNNEIERKFKGVVELFRLYNLDHKKSELLSNLI